MADNPFFRTPFALEGDQEAIPEALQSTGVVSFQTGYGFDYERDPASDPNAKDIERPKMNWLFWAITTVLRQYQTYGAFPYITPEQNNGTPFPYEKGARCTYDAGSGTNLYESLVTNNTALPTDATKWARVSVADLVPNTRKIIVTGSLTGGGTLDQDVTIGVNVPSSVPPTRTITTTAPLTGGGDLTANRTLGINAVSAATANAVIIRDAASRAQVQDPDVALDIANKKYVDAAIDDAIKVQTIGRNQTWQSFTSAQRNAGITYTNTTPRPIMVNISYYGGSGTVWSGTLDVDGVRTSWARLSTYGGIRIPMSAIVPAGSVYKLTVVEGGYDANASIWSELR